MFPRIYDQSFSIYSRVIPKYFNFTTPSASTPPSLLYKVNSIYPDICAISSSFLHSLISMVLLHLVVWMCHPSLVASMFILHWLHCGVGVRISCIITIFEFRCLYIHFSISLPGLCVLSGNPSTRNATDFNMRGKVTTYIYSLLPPTSTLRVYIMIIL